MKNFSIIAGLLFSATFLAGCSSQTVPSVPSPSPVESTSPVPSTEPSEVTLTSPLPNSTISSPLTISGQAPGTWFFEANIVGVLESTDGVEIARVPLQAQGEWMTEGLVTFEGDMTFAVPSGVTDGKIIIENDNPSGLPENSKSAEFPVQF